MQPTYCDQIHITWAENGNTSGNRTVLDNFVYVFYPVTFHYEHFVSFLEIISHNSIIVPANQRAAVRARRALLTNDRAYIHGVMCS